MYINLMITKNKNIYISYWLLLITLLVGLIIIVGGLTRLTDSGLSITRWDLFTGIIPPLSLNDWEYLFSLYKKIPEFKIINSTMTLNEFKVIFWWEYIHRLLGRLVGLFYLIPLIYFTYKKSIKGNALFFLYTILFLICLQGFIGWYMVLSGLNNRIDVSHFRLALHLLIAFVILSLIIWNYLKLNEIQKSNLKLNLQLPLIFLILIFSQISLGAFVSGMDAGTIYNSWPLMGSSYFPDDNNFINLFSLSAFSDPSLVQFMHRNLAYIIFIFYLFLLFQIHRKNLTKFYKVSKITGVILIIQTILGILTLLYGAQIYLASMHQISSIFLVSSSVYFLYLNTNV